MQPPTVDLSHSSVEAGTYFAKYHEAKSSHRVSEWLEFFDESAVCGDATLGWLYPDRVALELRLRSIDAAETKGIAYCTRVLGDVSTAIVAVTDTPERFGGEIRTLSAVDSIDGRIIRFIDYWDGRNFGYERTASWRKPADQFPDSLGEQVVASRADPALHDVSLALNRAFADADTRGVSALFAEESIFEEITLHTQLLGQSAIERYVSRTQGRLPYSRNARVVHVLGTGEAGGYERTAVGEAVTRGIIALELNHVHQITRFTSIWDGARLDDTLIKEMTALAAEPYR